MEEQTVLTAFISSKDQVTTIQDRTEITDMNYSF